MATAYVPDVLPDSLLQFYQRVLQQKQNTSSDSMPKGHYNPSSKRDASLQNASNEDCLGRRKTLSTSTIPSATKKAEQVSIRRPPSKVVRIGSDEEGRNEGLRQVFKDTQGKLGTIICFDDLKIASQVPAISPGTRATNGIAMTFHGRTTPLHQKLVSIGVAPVKTQIYDKEQPASPVSKKAVGNTAVKACHLSPEPSSDPAVVGFGHRHHNKNSVNHTATCASGKHENTPPTGQNPAVSFALREGFSSCTAASSNPSALKAYSDPLIATLQQPASTELQSSEEDNLCGLGYVSKQTGIPRHKLKKMVRTLQYQSRLVREGKTLRKDMLRERTDVDGVKNQQADQNAVTGVNKANADNSAVRSAAKANIQEPNSNPSLRPAVQLDEDDRTVHEPEFTHEKPRPNPPFTFDTICWAEPKHCALLNDYEAKNVLKDSSERLPGRLPFLRHTFPADLTQQQQQPSLNLATTLQQLQAQNGARNNAAQQATDYQTAQYNAVAASSFMRQPIPNFEPPFMPQASYPNFMEAWMHGDPKVPLCTAQRPRQLPTFVDLWGEHSVNQLPPGLMTFAGLQPIQLHALPQPIQNKIQMPHNEVAVPEVTPAAHVPTTSIAQEEDIVEKHQSILPNNKKIVEKRAAKKLDWEKIGLARSQASRDSEETRVTSGSSSGNSSMASRISWKPDPRRVNSGDLSWRLTDSPLDRTNSRKHVSLRGSTLVSRHHKQQIHEEVAVSRTEDKAARRKIGEIQVKDAPAVAHIEIAEDEKVDTADLERYKHVVLVHVERLKKLETGLREQAALLMTQAKTLALRSRLAREEREQLIAGLDLEEAWDTNFMEAS